MHSAISINIFTMYWCVSGQAFECLRGQDSGMATGTPLSLRYHSDQLNNKVSSTYSH